MKKKKQKSAKRKDCSVSSKLLLSFRKIRNEQTINIKDWRQGKTTAEELQQTVVSDKELAKLDPAHAIYVYAQNQLSVFVEQIAVMPELTKLVDAYEKAEDEYMPSFPPKSPLTSSYFTCWGFFDLYVGSHKETFGTIILQLCEFFKTNKQLTNIFQIMQQSRMGIYIHSGTRGELVFLRELITNKEMTAIVPSGYFGETGEMWLARVLPPPGAGGAEYGVVFTTPYVLGEIEKGSLFKNASEEKWKAYFDRNLKKTGIAEETAAYEALMKYGLTKNYWNEYIFLSYVNYRNNTILLAGFPDRPATLPHSPDFVL